MQGTQTVQNITIDIQLYLVKLHAGTQDGYIRC